MQKKDLLKALRSTKKEIQPNTDWKQSNRDILISQISAQTRVETGSERGNVFVPALRTLQFAAKPLAAMFIIVVVGLGSYTASVNATKNSLPGDLFYPVKLTSERVQVNFAKNKEEKAKLEIAFASRRLQEVQEVKKDPKKNVADLSVPIKKYTENVIQAKGHLEQVKHENVEVALVLADSLDDQTEEFIITLEEEKDTNTNDEVGDEDLDKDIKDAILATKDTNTAAVTLIIKAKSTEDGSEEDKEAVKDIVEEKLQQTEEKVEELEEKVEELETEEVAEEEVEESAEEETSDEEELVEEAPAEEATEDVPVEEAIETPEEAQDLLEEAKELLEEGKVEEAFEKITEADRKVFEADDVVEEVLEEAEAEEVAEEEAAEEEASEEDVAEESETEEVAEEPTEEVEE